LAEATTTRTTTAGLALIQKTAVMKGSGGKAAHH
jgi:hypothetical protein